MKKLKKIFSALLALLAVGLITVSLVACSSGDDSDSGSGNGGSNVDYVAKYAYTEARDDYKGEKTFTFYKNGTFEYIDEMTLSGEHSYHEKKTTKGTYTLEEGNWENGKVKLNATEGDEAERYTGTFTIKNKILKTNFYDFTATYTSKVEADSGKDNSDSNKDKDSGKDNSDTKTELVAYKRNTTTSDGDPKTELLTFYSDKTFALHETTADYDLDVCAGTYTGDPTKDGKVTATIKRMVSKSKMTKAFLEMGMAGVVTNEHAPLETCAEETMPCTISGNNLYDDEDKPMTKVDSNSSESEKTETTTEKSYTVTVTSPSNGTVSADKTSAKKGETVTITASANSGFELLSLTLKDAYGNKIEATADSSKTKYTFTMPDTFVIVNASFGKPYHAKYVWDPSKDPSDGRTGLYDYFVFYTDNTYEYIETVTLGSYSEKETDSAGTYTIDSGDWDNGTITLNATSGKKLNNYTGKCTITNGVFVCDDFTWSNKFTKE
jgi:hypothetical protein